MSVAGRIAGGALKKALEAAAAAVAALATAAVAGGKHLLELGDDYQQAVGQMSAQTGATGQELTELGDIAEQVYRNNFGESLNDVAASMSTVKTNTGLMGDELKAATENSYALRDTFGMEFAESSRAAAALMTRFGLSADEAYNLIAVGAQKGANQNGDLLDVISEYAPKYAEMGLSADQMMQTLINGAENGVFQIDKVGDAVKEFSIRAIDGSDQTKEAFKALGLNAAYMAAEIAEGGPVAENAFREVVAALMKVEDPIKRNTIAVALFGTQYEDLGQAALPILAGITDTSGITADALAQINAVKYDSLTDALGGVKRQIEGEFMPLAKTMSRTATAALNDVSAALSDGFQPEDIRVIGESIAGALMDGIGTLDALLNDNLGIRPAGKREAIRRRCDRQIVATVDVLHELMPQARAQLLTEAQAGEARGIGLGSQLSQLVQLAQLSAIDHYAKEERRVPVYERYMDDFNAIDESRERRRRWTSTASACATSRRACACSMARTRRWRSALRRKSRESKPPSSRARRRKFRRERPTERMKPHAAADCGRRQIHLPGNPAAHSEHESEADSGDSHGLLRRGSAGLRAGKSRGHSFDGY